MLPMFRFSRISLAIALSLVAVAGCQPFRPPSPAALKLIKAQTLTGPVNTKVRAKPFTYPVKAGELSLWDIKVFDTKDKDNGMLQEWKNFAQIPQQPGTTLNNTQVLMNAWIISKDGQTFLPQKPTYKAYGSFYTDWTLPRPGAYTLWLEYQPSVAHNEELSAAELLERRASYNLPREVGYWNFKAVGATLPGLKVDNDTSVHPSNGTALKTYNDRGERVAEDVTLGAPTGVRVGQKTRLQWALPSGAAPIQNPEIVAIAPDNSTLLHGIGMAPEMAFTMPGEWKLWFSYARGEQSFAAPYSLKVSPR